MKIRLILFSAIAILLFLSIACTKGNFELDKLHKKVPYDASFAAPLVYGDLSLYDALKSANKSEKFYINEDGYLSIDYLRIGKTKDINELFKIGDQTENKSFTYSLSLSDFNSEGQYIKEETFNQTLTVFNTEAIIDSITLKEGLMDIQLKSSFNNQVKVTLSIPSFKKNGQEFSEEINLQSSETEKSKNSIDCAGYKLDLKTDPANNSVPVKLKFEFISNNQASSNGQIDITYNIKGIKFKTMFGFFGESEIVNRTDSIDISLYKNSNIDIERFYFKNPKMKFNFSSSIGFPVEFHFSKLTAHSAIDGAEHHFISPTFPAGASSPYTIPKASSITEIKQDSIKVDNSNSNIAEIVNKRPQWLSYIANAKIKSDASASNRIDFVSDESNISFKLALEFPLWGYLHNISQKDTSKFDFNKEILSKSNDLVKRVMLRTDITNGLPCEAYGQIYFADVNNSVIDSLFRDNERILESAKVDGEGKVSEAVRKVTKIEITSETLNKLKDCKNIIFSAVGKTEESENNKEVKIYPGYRIKFKIGVEFDIEGELKPDMKI